MENAINYLYSKFMFENKITIKRFQDFILDVDHSNDTIKVI